MYKVGNGYYKNRHSFFLLQYHLVLITKYRKPVITGDLELFLKKYINDYFLDRDYNIVAIETMPDHLHILFEADPQFHASVFVNALKTGSSRVLRNRFSEELSKYYWKPYFWSLSYFLGTVSERTTAAVRNYIETQKE